MGQSVGRKLDITPGEVAARVVVALIDASERRGELMTDLSQAVRVSVEELDPNHELNSDPTWWADHPYVRPNAFYRLRLQHDQLLVLEAQAGEVVKDLRGGLGLRPVGSMERPVGYTPARAHGALLKMAQRRAQLLRDLRLTVRCLRPGLTAETAARLRWLLRAFESQEKVDQVQLARLGVMLAG